MWFVVKEVRAWEWVDDLNMFCWVQKKTRTHNTRQRYRRRGKSRFCGVGVCIKSYGNRTMPRLPQKG